MITPGGVRLLRIEPLPRLTRQTPPVVRERRN